MTKEKPCVKAKCMSSKNKRKINLDNENFSKKKKIDESNLCLNKIDTNLDIKTEENLVEQEPIVEELNKPIIKQKPVKNETGEIEKNQIESKHNLVSRLVSNQKTLKHNKTQIDPTSQASSARPSKNHFANRKNIITISNSIFRTKNKLKSKANFVKNVQNSSHEFELIKLFDSIDEYNEFISLNYYYTSITNSEKIRCCCLDCKKDTHLMTRIYRTCNCKNDSCSFKLRIYTCSITNKVYVYQKSKHNGSINDIKKTRGIDPVVKEMINEILNLEPNVLPSVVLKTLVTQKKLPAILVPKLRQVQNFITNIRNQN